MKLLFSALLKFLLGVVLVAVLVFLPAGTFDFFGGWLLAVTLFAFNIFKLSFYHHKANKGRGRTAKKRACRLHRIH